MCITSCNSEFLCRPWTQHCWSPPRDAEEGEGQGPCRLWYWRFIRDQPLRSGTQHRRAPLSSVGWSGTGAKLEPAVHCPPPEQQFQWSGTERQPPPWTDELAEMSRHIYTRHGIGDGLQKPVFQVGRCRQAWNYRGSSSSSSSSSSLIKKKKKRNHQGEQ